VLFTNTTLPAPGYITWQTNYNATAFVLSVVAHIATNTTRTNMSISTLSPTNILLQWPGDHTGWRIQAQTNPVTVGISSNWAILAGVSLTNQFVMPIDKTNGHGVLPDDLPVTARMPACHREPQKFCRRRDNHCLCGEWERQGAQEKSEEVNLLHTF